MAERAAKTTPGGSTELWYRRMLRLYPADYRHRFADEMIEILMQGEASAQRPSLGESWALISSGVRMRLRLTSPRGTWSRPASAGVAVLATLLAVIGVQELIGSAYGYLTTDAPDALSAVDRICGSAALALLAWALLVLRRPVPAAVGAWASVAAGVWTVRPAFDGLTRWGAPAEATTQQLDAAAAAVHDARQLALLVPALVLAVLLLRPGTAGRAVDVVGRRTLVRALTIGTAMALLAELGMSAIWAPVLTAAVLLAALVRESVLMRSALLVVFAFGYLVIAGLADGSGSRLPGYGPALTVSLALIPILAFLAGALVIRQIDFGTTWRLTIARRIEAFGHSLGAGGPLGPDRPS